MPYAIATDPSGVMTFYEGGVPPEQADVVDEAIYRAKLAEVELAQAPAQVPDRCSKLGLKRALAETGKLAVFKSPEWPAVKAAIELNPDLAEDWDLAVSIVRTDPLTQAMIAARGYDATTVDKILVRANQLAA